MSLGVEFQELATELIADGELWTHEITLTYGPRYSKANKWSAPTADAAIDPVTSLKVAAKAIEEPIDEAGKLHRMWLITIPAAALTTAPTAQDSVTIEGQQQNVINVTTSGAEGVKATYKVRTLR